MTTVHNAEHYDADAIRLAVTLLKPGETLCFLNTLLKGIDEKAEEIALVLNNEPFSGPNGAPIRRALRAFRSENIRLRREVNDRDTLIEELDREIVDMATEIQNLNDANLKMIAAYEKLSEEQA